MKKLYTSALFWITINSLAQAQISILSSDLTSIGDQITRYGDTIPNYGPGDSGAGVTWDFSAAVIEDTAETTVVMTSSTPYAATFSSSDYAMTADGSAYLYFNHSSSQMTTTGAAGDLLGTGEIIEAPFSNPLVLHNFPRVYQSTFDDVYQFEAEADGAAFNVNRIRLNHTGHVYDTTDGYGTLITPTGTYEALRVKSVEFSTDVIDVKLFSFAPWTNFATELDTSTTFSWHAKEEKLAIAEMSFDSIGNPARFTFSAIPPIITTSTQEHVNQDWSVYPVPSSDFLYLKNGKNTLGCRLEIYSMDGRLVLGQTLLSTRISISGLSNGTYILRIIDLDGTPHKPKRIVVAH